MAKTVKIHEKCIFTGNGDTRALVDRAKEALTTLSKNKVKVYIFLTNTSKDDAEKFLKEQKIPYTALITKDDTDGTPEKYDVCVLPRDGVVLFTSDWTWTLDDIARNLYGEHAAEKSDQEKMDDSWKQYLKLAKKSPVASIG